jgi:hypothetical protein
VRALSRNLRRPVPGNRDRITVAIELAGDVEALRPGFVEATMLARMLPIGGVHVARAVREFEAYRHTAAHRHGHQIERGMTARFHLHRFSVPLKFAVQHTRPQIERLRDRGDVGRIADDESDLAEVQAVRILAEPIEQLLLSL